MSREKPLSTSDMTKELCRQIIFSKTPLKNHFRFGDEFQIFPCDYENVPVSKFQYDFSIVLEYWYDKDEVLEVSEDLQDLENVTSFISENFKKLHQAIRITRLLTAITNHKFFVYNEKYETNGRWGVSLPEGEIKVGEKIPTSSWSIPWFQYASIADDLKITEFSTQRHNDFDFLPHIDYFTQDPIDDKNKVITFPSSVFNFLEIYFNVDPIFKKMLDTVMHLISNGIDLKLRMKSLSFLSFVSSIETLVNYHYKDAKDQIVFECRYCQTIKSSPIHCQKCDRPIWGIKAKFRDFLKTYVASSEASVTKFNKIYNLRSEIVHTGTLLLGDEQFNWKPTEKENKQWLIHIETMQLARLSLINWVVMTHKYNASR